MATLASSGTHTHCPLYHQHPDSPRRDLAFPTLSPGGPRWAGSTLQLRGGHMTQLNYGVTVGCVYYRWGSRLAQQDRLPRRGVWAFGEWRTSGRETGFDLSSSSAFVHWRFRDSCLQPHSCLPQPRQVVVSLHPTSWVRKLRRRTGK